MVPLSCLAQSGVFSTENIVLVIAILFLMLLSAFFSASEMAYSTSNTIRIRNFADEKVKGARTALKICENYDRTLSTILVGNNLVNIASTTIAAFFFIQLIKDTTVANLLNTFVMTIIVLIFGEILPKSLAKSKPETIALKFAPAMKFFIIVLFPITFLFTKLQKNVIKKSDYEEMPTVTEDELESIIDTMQEEGVIDSQDASLIQNVLDLGDKTAYDIMTPRVDVSAVEINEDIDKIKDLFLESNFSRIPVYKDDIDHIVGILNQKDFYSLLINNKNIEISKVMTSTLYINENIKVDEIIRKMQRAKKHLAVVLDEYGGTSGIVCLEDALETMVGEIYDEHDDQTEDQEHYKKIKEGEYLVDGEIELIKLFEKLEIENIPNTQYSTLAGYLYEMAENSMPIQNQQFVFNTIDEIYDKSGNYIEKDIKMIFKLEVVEEMRIKKVRIFISNQKKD